jgi:phenylacetate-CoA ligase
MDPAATANFPTPISAMAGLDWPAIPIESGNMMLGLLFQLEQSQWWPPEKLRAQQFRQAGELLRYARENVPYYRERFKDIGWDGEAPLDVDLWQQLPLLQREDIQNNDGRALLSERYPESHGKTRLVHTSGSSGKPLTVTSNTIAAIFWNVFTMRDFIWRRLDFSAKMAAIRFDAKKLTRLHARIFFVAVP